MQTISSQPQLGPCFVLPDEILHDTLTFLNAKELRICTLVNKQWSEASKQVLIDLLKDKVIATCIPAFNMLRNILNIKTSLPLEDDFNKSCDQTIANLRSAELSLPSLRKAWRELEHSALLILERQSPALLKYSKCPESNLIGKWQSISALKEKLEKEERTGDPKKLSSIFNRALKLQQPLLAQKSAIETNFIEKAILLNELVKYHLLDVDIESACKVVSLIPQPLQAEVKTHGLDSFPKVLDAATASNIPIKLLIDPIFENLVKEVKGIKDVKMLLSKGNLVKKEDIEKIEALISRITHPFYQSLALKEFALKLFIEGSDLTQKTIAQIPLVKIRVQTISTICKSFKALGDWDNLQKYAEMFSNKADQTKVVKNFFLELCSSTSMEELWKFAQKIPVEAQREAAIDPINIKCFNKARNFEDCVHATEQILGLADTCSYKEEHLMHALHRICNIGANTQAYLYAADLILQEIQDPSYQESCWKTLIVGLCSKEDFDLAEAIAKSCENEPLKKTALELIKRNYQLFNEELAKPCSLADPFQKRKRDIICWSFDSCLRKYQPSWTRYAIY